MASIKDRTVYFVLAKYRSGVAFAERDPADMDRATTIKDIASGQFEQVIQILECNPVEHICSDVTEEIMKAAEAEWATEYLAAQLDAKLDHARDLRKHEAA